MRNSVQKNSYYQSQAGFSLAELSIVITIVGLLVALVAAGVNVRRTSELHGMLSAIEEYQAAIQSFDAQYDEYPGDMSDAHDYWDDGADGVCGTATQCNGDGDGGVEEIGGDAATTPANSVAASASDDEIFRFWQHLVLAELLDGGYTGVGGGSGGLQADIAINVPSTPRTKVGIIAIYGALNGSSRNELRIGGFALNAALTGAALKPVEALALDKKTDDGNAEAGLVRAIEGTETYLSAGDCESGGTYASGDELTCRMSFPMEAR